MMKEIATGVENGCLHGEEVERMKLREELCL